MQSQNEINETLSRRLEEVSRANEKLTIQVSNLERTLKEMLSLFKKKEQLQELQISRTVQAIFSGINNSLEHSVEALQNRYVQSQYGYIIKVVDGVNEVVQDDSILVVKVGDTYNFSEVKTPEVHVNENTEHIARWLKDNDHVFAGGDRVAINLYLTNNPEKKNG